MPSRPTQQDHANIGELAERYLAACYPVDFTQIDLSGYSAIAEGLTDEGMEHTSEVRRDVLHELSTGVFSAQDTVARGQLHEWVSAEHELMESGEKYRPLSQIDAPHARISRALRATVCTKPVDWSAVCDGLAEVARCFREELELLKRGTELGFVATRREASFARQRYLSLSSRANDWLDASLRSDGDAVLMQEARVQSAQDDVARSADELVEFLEQWYLPRALDQQGIGRDRFALWSRKVLGEDIDLDELYDEMWDELRETMQQLEIVATRMMSGGSVRDLVWNLDADLGYELEVAEGLPRWIRRTVEAEAAVIDAELVRLPAGATDFVLSGLGDDIVEMLEIHVPALDGRRGIVLMRALNNMNLSIWSYTALLHLQVLPGEHLFNCFLVDPETQLQRFQRVLVSPAARSGWMSHAAMLAAFELDRDVELHRLNGLRTRVRELVCALADIGSNLGLKLPDNAPEFAGESWSDELLAQAIAQWGHIRREFAKNRVSQVGMSPGYSLGAIVGSRVRDEALQRARANAGRSFDIRGYHERVLRLAPTGTVGLRTQLEAVAELV